ncbi:hypothetical protein [Streptomyces griseosporeus]|uniref:hypothetical protein n=1 Tax=Streptomyces griseosporeus TaxID=1910 RepID=UPI0036FD36E6
MLRITDDRTGEPVEAAPVRRGLTRVEAHAPGCDAGALRVLLVADLLVRALELGGTPVWALLNAERQRDELRAGAAALGIRPLEDTHDTTTGLGEAQIVHVAQDPTAAPDGVLVRVGPVVWAPGPAASGPEAEADSVDPAASAPEAPEAQVAGVAPASAPEAQADEPHRSGALPPGADPAAVRLALLSVPRAAPVRLDDDALADAEATLARWRRAVAGWACRPSRPIPDDVRARLRAAWEDDLDIPAVLGVLRGVAEAAPDDLPEGARFETYVYADRLLGLDLARDVGTLP